MTSNRATASAALFDCSGPISRSCRSGQGGPAAGPAALRLLHPVLAEDALAGGEGGVDGLGRLGLGDGGQGDGGRVAADRAGDGVDARPHGGDRARRQWTGARKAGDDDGMDGSGTLSNEARILWDAARGLAREAASVSARAGLPPLLFSPTRSARPSRGGRQSGCRPGRVWSIAISARRDAEAVARRLKAISRERG
jgi:hypothetical protein